MWEILQYLRIMPNLVLFSVLWLDCSLCSDSEVWREMDSDGQKKGKKGRGREGMGREFRRETARVVEGRRGTPEGHHNRHFPALSPNTNWAAKPINLFYVFFFVPFHSFYLEVKPICYKNFSVYCEVLNFELLVFRYLLWSVSWSKIQVLCMCYRDGDITIRIHYIRYTQRAVLVLRTQWVLFAKAFLAQQVLSY